MIEGKTAGRLLETVRMGGYLVAGGALIGFSSGAYLLLNRELLGLFIGVSQSEVMSYFLSVFMPSFVILIITGYLFATSLGLKKADLSSVAPLCILSLLSMVLSALSVFYMVSFFGSFLTLMALVRSYTKPAFTTLSRNEAFFLTEIGAMFIASSSALFLLMWLISNFFQTYAMGFYGTYSPFALLLVGAFSFLIFFGIPLLGSHGTDAGFCGVFGLIVTILSYLLVVQNRFVFFNISAILGILVLVAGLISAFVGDLVYVRLLFRPTRPTTSLMPTLLFKGKYCPHCGKLRVSSLQDSCYDCGRSLMWTPYSPFCPSCGRLVPTHVQTCPHCQEDIRNRQIYFQLKDAEQQQIAKKVLTESRKKKSWITKGLLRILQTLPMVRQPFLRIYRFFNVIVERASLTLKEVVFIIILTYLLGFVSFIFYLKVAPFPSTFTRTSLVFTYGFPLEWLQVKTVSYTHPYKTEILWIPLIVDILFYFLVSFAIVYAVAKWRR